MSFAFLFGRGGGDCRGGDGPWAGTGPGAGGSVRDNEHARVRPGEAFGKAHGMWQFDAGTGRATNIRGPCACPGTMLHYSPGAFPRKAKPMPPFIKLATYASTVYAPDGIRFLPALGNQGRVQWVFHRTPFLSEDAAQKFAEDKLAMLWQAANAVAATWHMECFNTTEELTE